MITLEGLLARSKKVHGMHSDPPIRGVFNSIMADCLNPRQQGEVSGRLMKNEQFREFRKKALEKSEKEFYVRALFPALLFNGLTTKVLEAALAGDYSSMRASFPGRKEAITDEDGRSILGAIQEETAYMDEVVTKKTREIHDSQSYLESRAYIMGINTTDKVEEARTSLSRLFWIALTRGSFLGMDGPLFLLRPEDSDKFRRAYEEELHGEELAEIKRLAGTLRDYQARAGELDKVKEELRRKSAELEARLVVPSAPPLLAPQRPVEIARTNGHERAAARIASLERQLRESESREEEYRGLIKLAEQEREGAKRDYSRSESQIDALQERIRMMEYLMGLNGRKVALIGGKNGSFNKVKTTLGRYGIEVSHLHGDDRPSESSVISAVRGATYVLLRTEQVGHPAQLILNKRRVRYFTLPQSLEGIEEFVYGLSKPSVSQ